MIVLSSKFKYGIAALMELANYYGKGLLRTKVIAGRRHIPPNYLEQLLNLLTRAGLVKAVRGNKGGYELAVNPAEITFLQVWEIMEGGIEIGSNNSSRSDAIQDLCREAEEEIKRVFNISLAELLTRQQAYDEMITENIIFHI